MGQMLNTQTKIKETNLADIDKTLTKMITDIVKRLAEEPLKNQNTSTISHKTRKLIEKRKTLNV